MALPEDFNKIYGSTATGGLTPISDVNYAKGWEFVGANPPTKNDFSYLQNLSDRKSQWLYSNKLQRANPFGDIKSDGTVQTALENIGLTNAIIGDHCKAAGFDSGSELAPYLMHEDTHTAIRLVTLDSVRRVTTGAYTINYYANGLIQILGVTPIVSSSTSPTMTFPVAFPTACIRFSLHNRESGVPSYNMAMYSNLSRTGVKIWGVANILGNAGSPTLVALPEAEISYEAWGY